jgi:hypothetical protein
MFVESKGRIAMLVTLIDAILSSVGAIVSAVGDGLVAIVTALGDFLNGLF